MGAFMLGPLLIKYEWVLILLAGIVSYIAISLSFSKTREFKKDFLNEITNGVLIGFFSYKFSSILFQTENVMSNPIAILYISGGTKGVILGIILAMSYVGWRIQKYTYWFKSWISGIVYGTVTFMLAFWLFRTLFILVF
ncbi:hypothetical protein [Cytobacillus sp. NCCP-133]|uniref:hypothetical protein n=1 Tax=Cytobacillus sp. NCCP-133 TaxID=766848 RepID=UPI0022310B21|nr:hypothetical protein [Cytobacillus sp. NCCP-133]GLB60795.1 hypothetical protein NCCP133_29270 [Cytobacillus sp. NCCP-133]